MVSIGHGILPAWVMVEVEVGKSDSDHLRVVIRPLSKHLRLASLRAYLPPMALAPLAKTLETRGNWLPQPPAIWFERMHGLRLTFPTLYMPGAPFLVDRWRERWWPQRSTNVIPNIRLALTFDGSVPCRSPKRSVSRSILPQGDRTQTAPTAAGADIVSIVFWKIG